MGLRSSVMSQAESFEAAAKLKPLGNNKKLKQKIDAIDSVGFRF